MPKFTLAIVEKVHPDGKIEGGWIQNHIGTLDTAIAWARHTEEVNSNKIDVAVINEIAATMPFSDFPPATRLDVRRIGNATN